MNLNSEDNKRTGYFKSVATISGKIIAPTLRKFGIVDTKLLAEWENIVGAKLARKVIPLKITRNKNKGLIEKNLHLLVDHATTAMTLSYQKDIIIEKIAYYLGTDFIHNIKIIQGLELSYEEEEEKITPNALYELPLNVEIEDENLNNVLMELGSLIKQK